MFHGTQLEDEGDSVQIYNPYSPITIDSSVNSYPPGN